MLLRSVLVSAPPTLAVARAYRREVVRRPGFLALLVAGVALLVFSRAFASFGFGQERSLVRQGMLETISMVVATIVILFGAAAVGRDLESRSVLLLLAKPLSRPAFLVGRFFALFQACAYAAAPLLVLAIVLLGAGEANPPADRAEAVALVQGVLIALGQAMALAALVLVLSATLPSALVLPLAIGLALLGLVAEPLRASLAPDAPALLHGLLRTAGLLLPPLHEPAAAGTVAFEGGLETTPFLIRISRSIVYSIAALSAAAMALGRKDLT